MHVEMVRDLHYYNDWATGLVLSCAGEITSEQLVAGNDTPWGSIRNQLAHVMDVHRRWLNWADGTMTGEEAYSLSVNYADYPDVAALSELWTDIQAQTHRFLDRMTEEDLTRELTYASDDFGFAIPVGKVMTHIVLHSMQHRAEAAMALTRLGQSPGDIDYIFYAFQQSPSASTS